MKKLTIVKEEVLKMDISHLKNSQCPWKEWNLVEGEHHKLCAYLSTKFNSQVLIDAGTSYGNSAIALSYNSKNTVRTYDIAFNDFESFKERKNILPIQKDINEEDIDVLLSSPLILLDIDPHDGKQELIFTNRLREIKYEGFVICDDIHLNSNMSDWWKNLDLEKHDITDIGHHHGTGLICFGKVEVKIV
jgi:hypothetical protein